ncbi:hypothetical protein SCARD494_06628 [Seiridium cardinale]
MAQATWVSLRLMPVIAVNSVPPAVFAALPGLKITDFLGLALYLCGFAFDVTAGRQKSKWMHGKRTKQRDEEFLIKGPWSSQYPNYFGESTLWTGIAIAAAAIPVTWSLRRCRSDSG